MTVDELKEANGLVQEIEKTERLLAAYREAERIEIAIKSENDPLRGSRTTDHVTLTVVEIGDAIVTALERRIVTMKANLRALGVD